MTERTDMELLLAESLEKIESLCIEDLRNNPDKMKLALNEIQFISSNALGVYAGVLSDRKIIQENLSLTSNLRGK